MIDVVNIDWTCYRLHRNRINNPIDYNHIFEVTREMVIPRVGFFHQASKDLGKCSMDRSVWTSLLLLLIRVWLSIRIMNLIVYRVNGVKENASIGTGCTKVPLLSNLKKLVIDNNDQEADCETVLPLIVDLLQLAPNLEEFEYMYVFLLVISS